MKPLALIVEDEPSLATIFAKALQEADFRTEILTDGQAVMIRLAQLIPELMILDLHLPNVSGRQILQHVRTSDRLAQTRIVIVSADAELAEELQDQADLTLEKPVSFHQLRTLMRRYHPDYRPGSTGRLPSLD